MPPYEPICDSVEVVRSIEDLGGFADRLLSRAYGSQGVPRGSQAGTAAR